MINWSRKKKQVWKERKNMNRVNNEEEVTKDMLADYPEVEYSYEVEEIAFLLHKLNQFGLRFKSSKRKILTKRDKELQKISENFEVELKKFVEKELSMVKNLEGGLWQKLIDLYSKHMTIRKKYRHREFEEIRLGQTDNLLSG